MKKGFEFLKVEIFWRWEPSEPWSVKIYQLREKIHFMLVTLLIRVLLAASTMGPIASILPSTDSSCTTAVECTLCYREVVGSNPTGCWAIFLFSIHSVVRPSFRSLKEIQNYWFSDKNVLSCARWGQSSLISTEWAKELILPACLSSFCLYNLMLKITSSHQVFLSIFAIQ